MKIYEKNQIKAETIATICEHIDNMIENEKNSITYNEEWLTENVDIDKGSWQYQSYNKENEKSHEKIEILNDIIDKLAKMQ